MPDVAYTFLPSNQGPRGFQELEACNSKMLESLKQNPDNSLLLVSESNAKLVRSCIEDLETLITGGHIEQEISILVAQLNKLAELTQEKVETRNRKLDFLFRPALPALESVHLDPNTVRKYKTTVESVAISDCSKKLTRTGSTTDTVSVSSQESFSTGVHSILVRYDGFLVRDKIGSLRCVGVHGDASAASAASYTDRQCYGVYVTLRTTSDNYVISAGTLKEADTLHVDVGSELLVQLDCDKKLLTISHLTSTPKWKRQIPLPLHGPWHFHFCSYSVSFSLND